MRAGILCCVMALVAARSAQAAPQVELAQSSVVVQKTRLWTEPNRFGEPKAILVPGLKVDVLDYSTSQDWVMVRTPSGREGWIKVRMTTLGGRRTDEPLISARKEEDPDAPRDPASEDDAPAASAYSAAMPAGGPPVTRKPHKKDGPIDGDVEEFAERKGKKAKPKGAAADDFRHSWGASLEYNHQLSPESMPGFALRPNFFWRMNEGFWIGAGLDYMYFFRGLSDSAANAKTERSINRFVPQAIARYRKAALEVDASLGLDLQRTSVTTSDLTTGATIPVNDAGQAVSGSAWDTGIAFRISPAYMFRLDDHSALGAKVTYVLSKMLGSGSGASVGPSTSGFQHVLGGGIEYRRDF